MAFHEGYVATVLGAVAGAVIAAMIVLGLALIFAPAQTEDCDDVDCLVEQSSFPVVAQAAHFALSAGAAAGCWLALRLRRQEKPGLTAVIVCGLYLVAGYALGLFVILLLVAVLISPLSGDLGVGVLVLVIGCSSIATMVICPIAARHLALR